MSSQSDPTGFNKFLRTLEPNASSVDDGFLRCRTKLVKFFFWRRCDDPDNLADETTTRLLNKVQAGQEISGDNPYGYVFGIAKNVLREYLKAKNRRGFETDIDELRDAPALEGTENCSSLCLALLSPEKREFLEEYYLDGIDREEFAREKNMTINALRLKVFRLREVLRHCMENCLRRFNSARN